MRFLRSALVLATLATPAFAQPPGGFGGGGEGRGGPGGGGMRMMFGGGGNPDDVFNMFAKGKDVLRRDDMDPMMQRMFDRFASQMNITNGQITRDPFKPLKAK